MTEDRPSASRGGLISPMLPCRNTHSYLCADAFHAGCDGSSPTRRRHLPHFRPQPLLCFGGGKDGDLIAFLRSRASKAEAQELNLVGWAHATLLLVDLKPHARLQKSPNRRHDALSGALAAHE